jgi:hypothetical protein
MVAKELLLLLRDLNFNNEIIRRLYGFVLQLLESKPGKILYLTNNDNYR